MKGTGPNHENSILDYFFVNWENLLKIDDLKADNSTKIYLDKINMLLDTYPPLKKSNKYKLKKSLNLRLTKINICKKQITYKFY